jgi:hypothetical protein
MTFSNQTSPRDQLLNDVLSTIDTYFSPVRRESGDPIYEVYSELRGEIAKLADSPKENEGA